MKLICKTGGENMRKMVILGAGTAGTMMLNKLVKVLNRSEWEFTIIDKDENHYYQPGFLFVPFGIYKPEIVVRKKREFFPQGINAVFAEFDRIDPESSKVIMKDGKEILYDLLIVATGCNIRPAEIEGLKGPLWYKNIFDFYTYEGAVALSKFLSSWKGGRLVLNVVEMPIKCPVAPLEFLLLADYFFKQRNMRDKVELHYATPLSSVFTKPKCADVLGYMLKEKDIRVTTEYNIGRVDNENKKILSHDEQEIPFDLLVIIPTNMGDSSIENSGMGDELNFIPTDKETLRSLHHKNIFVIGDATDLPSSKAGSVAHFQADVLTHNILDVVNGREPSERFDGHANCFIESGHGKAFLIDFNYKVEPLPGKFPLPVVGPFSLLKETKINHLGKLGFRHFYWNILLKGRDLPMKHQMSMRGKIAD